MLSSIFNDVLFMLFTLIEFVFIAYFPLNQIYSDFVILNRTSLKQESFKLNPNGTLITNSTLFSDQVLTNVYSVLSTTYENLKGTGLYGEKIVYEKRFTNETRDIAVAQVVSYLNIDYILDQMNFTDYVEKSQYFCHGFIAFYVLYVIMIFTRKPGTISLSGQRQLVTKIFSALIVLIAKATQMPLITFMLKIFACNNDEVYFDKLQAALQETTNLITSKAIDASQAQISVPYNDYCYTGDHLSQVIYMSMIIVLYYSLVAFFHYFLTLSYPTEGLTPWACLPTKLPILIELTKFLIVFSYSESNIAHNGLSYLNIVFAFLWLAILFKRIRHALIFRKNVYQLTMCGEASMFVIFGYAALRDFVDIDRNFTLHVILLFSCAFASYTAILVREQTRLKSLSRVDFAMYDKDFDALIMMITLHELIERSSQEESQDFLLRGFIERHIEICEYQGCTCIRFYQISNQNYRLELAQASPFSRQFDSNGAMSNANLQQQQTRNSTSMALTTTMTTNKDQSDGDELSTLKVFYGGSTKNQQKVNKKKQKFLKKFLIDNINVFLEIFPGSVKLHIMAAFIYFSIFKNSFKSLYELSFTRSKQSSLRDQYECFVLSSQVIDYFQGRASRGISNQPAQFEKAPNSKDDKKSKKVGEFNSASFEVDSEIQSVIEFEKINIQFQKMIEQTSIQTRKFWQEILKKNIDVEKVFGLGAKIYKNFVVIKKLYKQLMDLNSGYLEVAYLYKIFVSLILNFEIEVEDAKLQIIKIMQTKSMKKHNIKAEYKTIQNKEENGMIIISGSTGNFAKILAMNNKAERTFGYGTNELMSQSLHRLMPRLFAVTHEDLILNFINGNRKINKENHQFVWGKHKSGFIIPLIMEINAYVNFEFNFCFIALIKRSQLLEFKPMRELLDYLDIFVMQVSQTGIIQDITQNMSEYLNFPLQALNKDISVEQFFRGLFDDELEQSFQNGRKVEFDPAVIKRILEQEDIDIRGEGDSDGGGANTFNMSEKKCAAYVWLRNYDYTEQEVKLQYREIWFVLTEDDTTFLDTRGTTEYMTNMGEEHHVKQNVTYTEEREDICSIASMSSLANYDKNRKNIMAKLSEIKTQTIDDQKPRQIDLLQKAIVLVFLSVIAIAILLMAVSSDRNSGFVSNVELIHQSKEAVLNFAELRLLLSTLVHYSNSRFNYQNDLILSSPIFPKQILDETKTHIEDLRKIQSFMNFVTFDYSDKTLTKKRSLATDFMQIRSNKIIESLGGNMSMIQGIKEYLDVANDVTAQSFLQDLKFDTSILNFDSTNSSRYNGSQIGQSAINYYQLLRNGHGSLGNYLMDMSELYIDDAIYQVNQNSSLVLILTIVSIAITILTALVILPILHKIERSKEKVLMIYTELKKEQIESLNRNIKVFFIKLQSGANQVSSTLSFNSGSKQFSNKLMTRKFTMNPQSVKRSSVMGSDDDFTSALMASRPSIAQMDLMGGAEMLEADSSQLHNHSISNSQKHGGISGSRFAGSRSKDSNKQIGGAMINPFDDLLSNTRKDSKFQSTDPRRKGGNKRSVNGLFRPTSHGIPHKKSSSKTAQGDSFKQSSKLSKASDNNSDEERDKFYSGDDEEGGARQNDNEYELEGDENEGYKGMHNQGDMENADEDKRARILMSKEEAENTLFKRLFQNKIKQMTCVKQVKYYTLVAFISLVMCGYFTLSYFMVTNIFKDSQSSLKLFDIVANRGPYLDSLISTFIQTQIRQKEIFVYNLGQIQSPPTEISNGIDYFLNLTQTNENLYASLRKQLSTNQMINGASSIIQGLESQNMCDQIIDEAFVKEENSLVNRTANQRTRERANFIEECNTYANKLLQLGLQQTVNSIIQNILQGTIQFREGVAKNNPLSGLLKQDKEQQLFMIIMVKIKYLNKVDINLMKSFKSSILSYFEQQQSNYILVFAIFISLILILMVLLSYNGVEYLFKNLIAIKFILNFIPGQWLIENNAAEDLKYVEF